MPILALLWQIVHRGRENVPPGRNLKLGPKFPTKSTFSQKYYFQVSNATEMLHYIPVVKSA